MDEPHAFVAGSQVLQAPPGLLPPSVPDHLGLPPIVIESMVQALDSRLPMGWPTDPRPQFRQRPFLFPLDDARHHGSHLFHKTPIQRRIEPLKRGRQILLQLRCPLLAFFLT